MNIWFLSFQAILSFLVTVIRLRYLLTDEMSKMATKSVLFEQSFEIEKKQIKLSSENVRTIYCAL